MGSQSRYHGLAGIRWRRQKSKVAPRARKARSVEAKKGLLAELREALKSTPAVVSKKK